MPLPEWVPLLQVAAHLAEWVWPPTNSGPACPNPCGDTTATCLPVIFETLGTVNLALHDCINRTPAATAHLWCLGGFVVGVASKIFAIVLVASLRRRESPRRAESFLRLDFPEVCRPQREQPALVWTPANRYR
jgi:hypothetical protein